MMELLEGVVIVGVAAGGELAEGGDGGVVEEITGAGDSG